MKHAHNAVPNARLRRAVVATTAFGLWIIVAAPNALGASAVAVAFNPQSGKLSFGFSKGANAEATARKRAIRYCKSMGWLYPKVIHSTNRDGYGAIVSFDKGDNKDHFAASLAADTPKTAIDDALRNAKAAGGRFAYVEALWSDNVAKKIDLSKRRWPRIW